ncbi:MATE family efflux transporter [Cyclobacterium amurskyense]|uniref:Multidrug-efflux transporter n=1 Tax=Cyclobacterium amurskyense TaxID=320787 RepID=A0A0H4PED5_9BACT|nr:MATE family efflux transporter [Cyclobacterium amurskyense]AKP52841.1 Multi antimicrobial extrusion protein (Na(+)/drug antiporter) [Cyclobacterium amurskyense]|tara:strand:+ start:4616 stop:6010 length:1395 start_codon:yes stop_codon:yes gene_type:complete
MKKLISTYDLILLAISGSEQDFTKLPIKRGIFLLAIPMILEMIMESLFAVVDIFFVGRLGEHAVATVGLTEAVLTIIYSLGVGISMAGTALVARRFGEKKYKQAGTLAFQLLLVGVLVSVALGIAGFIYAEDVLRLMGAESTVLVTGTAYTRIIFAGNTAVMLLFLINGIFRGAGSAHLAMRALWISNGLNIILDPLLIFGLGSIEGLGLVGAAWATTIGRSIGVVYQMYHLLNGKHRLVIKSYNLLVRWETLKKIINISIGGMGQFLVDSAAWIVLTRIASEFGSVAVAGYTIAFRILLFSLMPAWGLSAAAATLVGQNLGAGKAFRAEIATYLTARYNFIFLATVTLIYLFFADFLAGIFTQDEGVRAIAATGLKVTVLGYVFYAVGMVMVQAFNGAGDTKTPAYINISIFWLLEIPLAYYLAIIYGLNTFGIFITIALCHSLHALVALYFFRKGKWKFVKT